MSLDYGRQKDLELLYKEYEKAPYKHDREEIERTIDRILRTSVPIRSLRQKLLLATHAKDRRAVKKIIMEINYHKQNETYGREIS